MKILQTLIATTLLAASLSVHADTLTYTFTGTCTIGCDHPPVTTAHDTLVITNTKAGEAFGLSNLVSFNGTGAVVGDVNSISGLLPTTSGAGSFSEWGSRGTGQNVSFINFSTHSDGSWSASWISEIGFKVKYNYSGIGGTWTLTDTIKSPVPEPEQYMMLALGLALIGVAARSRKSA